MRTDSLAFGVQIACDGMRWPECLEICRAAEELGYESVWVPDHYVSTPDGLVPDERGPLLEGWLALGAMAQATRRVRLGPLVASCTFRHPAILAKLAASLDHVSGGRMELGMGAGWYAFEHDSLGLPFPPVGERLRQLEEAVRVVKALWTQERVDFEGRYYRLRRAVSEPKPLQQPPPLTIGATGEKVGLRNVARYADHWNTYCPPHHYPRKVEALARHCKAAGRDPAEIRRSIMMPAYVDEDEVTRTKIARWGEMVRARDGDEARQWFLVGDPSEMRDRIDRFAREGVSLFIVQVDRSGRNVDTLRRFAKLFL